MRWERGEPTEFASDAPQTDQDTSQTARALLLTAMRPIAKLEFGSRQGEV